MREKCEIYKQTSIGTKGEEGSSWEKDHEEIPKEWDNQVQKSESRATQEVMGIPDSWFCGCSSIASFLQLMGVIRRQGGYALQSASLTQPFQATLPCLTRYGTVHSRMIPLDRPTECCHSLEALLSSLPSCFPITYIHCTVSSQSINHRSLIFTNLDHGCSLSLAMSSSYDNDNVEQVGDKNR
jgi:hypothetical protein